MAVSCRWSASCPQAGPWPKTLTIFEHFRPQASLSLSPSLCLSLSRSLSLSRHHDGRPCSHRSVVMLPPEVHMGIRSRCASTCELGVKGRVSRVASGLGIRFYGTYCKIITSGRSLGSYYCQSSFFIPCS